MGYLRSFEQSRLRLCKRATDENAAFPRADHLLQHFSAVAVEKGPEGQRCAAFPPKLLTVSRRTPTAARGRDLRDLAVTFSEVGERTFCPIVTLAARACSIVALLALLRPGEGRASEVPASVQSCNTQCQSRFTDCVLACDGALPCEQACKTAVTRCVAECRR
jgi:hypothetical protein